MPISPGVPTSFVPRAPQPSPRQGGVDAGTNIFLIVAAALFAVTLLCAGAIFAYDKLLTKRLESRADALASAQSAANKSQVQNFIRLRDRLSSAQELLNRHVVLSGFFDTIESLTPQNIQYSTLTVTVAGDNTAQVEITGVAKNFNTLASQSNGLATNKHIKHAIFSGINLNKEAGGIGFTLKATVDSALIVGNTPAAALPAAAAEVPVVAPAPAPATPTSTATTTKP